jgi:hypothetical protein
MPALPSRPDPVQKFKPTHGTVLGYLGLVVAALVVLALLTTEPGLTGVRWSLGIAIAAVLVWAVMIRPRATAYDETLVLHHALSDTHLPLAQIDTVVVRQMLNVWIGEHRYLCAGIGRSTRKLLKSRSRGPMAGLGLRQADDHPGMGDVADFGSGADYATFVETRIEDLARSAKRDRQSEPPRVRRTWAVPELTALAVLGAAFVASLMLG